MGKLANSRFGTSGQLLISRVERQIIVNTAFQF